MNILGVLKAKYMGQMRKRNLKLMNRQQFNTTISVNLVLIIRLLAEELKLPRYVVTEHLIQVGAYHVIKASEDLDKDNLLQEHLKEDHLLGSGGNEDESILTLGCEESYVRELMVYIATSYQSQKRLKEKLDLVIANHCTKEDQETIAKLKAKNDSAMSELLIWMKKIELGVNPTEE